jgi:hypothetical protein
MSRSLASSQGMEACGGFAGPCAFKVTVFGCQQRTNPGVPRGGWKDAIYQETKHLPPREALHEILRQAHEAAVAHGFVKKTPAVLAETPPPYGGMKP